MVCEIGLTHAAYGPVLMLMPPPMAHAPTLLDQRASSVASGHGATVAVFVAWVGDACKRRSLAAVVDFAQTAGQPHLLCLFRARIYATSTLPGWTPPVRAVTAPIISAGVCARCTMYRLFVGTPAV